MENSMPFTSELCESLRALSLKRRQGVLEILAPGREYELTFLDGKIVHADRLDTPLYEFIFKRLSEKERSQVNLQEVEERGRAEALTYIEESAQISRQKLSFLKKQYDRETLLLLSKERSYSFDFRTRIVRCAEEISLGLSPGHFLLDLLEAQEAGRSEKNPEPAVMKEVVPVVEEPKVEKKKPRRKSKRPPRVAKWKATSEARLKREQILEARNRSERALNQLFISIKLLLFLAIVIFGPAFIVDWFSELNRFAMGSSS